jgi:hypothetical protein
MCRKVMYLVAVVVSALSLTCYAQGIEPAADAYVRAGAYTDTNYGDAGSLVLKNASNDFNRQVYFRFAVSAPVAEASIDLTVATNNEGGGGTTPQTFTVEVYGLAEALDDSWTEAEITWNNAPGNDTATHGFTEDATKLGSFLVEETPSGGSVSFTDPNLISFINQDTDHQITLMLRRTTGTSSSHNLVFASKEHATHAPAQLHVRTANRASGAQPAIAATDVPRDVVLGWMPGMFAHTHDLYLGMSFADVNAATVPLQAGLDVNAFDAGRLELGQTYFWRVDEVNGAPDHTVFKGDVWSFTVEPVSIPITGITVTASSAHDDTLIPENTINGSGLDALDQHATEPTSMWLSGMGDAVPWLEYAFDQVYKLHELWVWNSNQLIENFVGLGAKDVSIEISTNGSDWILLPDTGALAQAPGKAGYAHNTTIDMGGVLAQYVRLNIHAGYGMVPQYGLSEVRFFFIPTVARAPQPTDAERTDTVDVTLSWRAGREAAAHEVYLGTDSAELPLVQTTTKASAAVGPLDYGATYFWQIVEVNDAEDPAAYASDIWSFGTPAYGVVENFDAYDDDCQRIFFAWLDGLGHNGGADLENCEVPPYNGNGTGSIVGNALAPFAEQTIVFAGRQSMPLEYDSGVSEATLTLDGQDWTVSGIQSLSLQFYGDPGNTGQFYVKINNTKLSYQGLTDALQRSAWTTWNIDLAATGAQLDNVTSLTLGIEGASALGRLYVDEIRLYPLAPELIAPVDPGTTGLAAYYPLDGDYQDASGNERHGTPLGGNPSFAPGAFGQALNLNAVTITEHIEISGYQGIVADQADPANPVQAAFTVACWINTIDNGSLVFWGSADGAPVGGQYQNFRIDGGRLRSEHGNGRFRGATTVNDGEWHHVALAVETGTDMTPPGTRIFVDGFQDAEGADTVNAQNIWNITADVDMAIGARTTAGDRFFVGLIDEIKVFDRALSNAEIAWLAGLTQPFDKAFDAE